jgi:COMPASS component SPP1
MGSVGVSSSRSTSVIPHGGTPGVGEDAKMDMDEVEVDGELRDIDDDKLYCVCRSMYDEDRLMIACDRWVLYLLF